MLDCWALFYYTLRYSWRSRDCSLRHREGAETGHHSHHHHSHSSYPSLSLVSFSRIFHIIINTVNKPVSDWPSSLLFSLRESAIHTYNTPAIIIIIIIIDSSTHCRLLYLSAQIHFNIPSSSTRSDTLLDFIKFFIFPPLLENISYFHFILLFFFLSFLLLQSAAERLIGGSRRRRRRRRNNGTSISWWKEE